MYFKDDLIPVSSLPHITFLNEKKSVLVETGVTILEAARHAGILVESPCNGIGSCGKCKIKIPEQEHRDRIKTLETQLSDDEK